MSGLMEARFDVSCPVCGGMIHPTIEDVRMERTVVCPNGHQVALVDQGDGARRLDAELNKLERQLRQLGGKLTIKL